MTSLVTFPVTPATSKEEAKKQIPQLKKQTFCCKTNKENHHISEEELGEFLLVLVENCETIVKVSQLCIHVK